MIFHIESSARYILKVIVFLTNGALNTFKCKPVNAILNALCIIFAAEQIDTWDWPPVRASLRFALCIELIRSDHLYNLLNGEGQLYDYSSSSNFVAS